MGVFSQQLCLTVQGDLGKGSLHWLFLTLNQEQVLEAVSFDSEQVVMCSILMGKETGGGNCDSSLSQGAWSALPMMTGFHSPGLTAADSVLSKITRVLVVVPGRLQTQVVPGSEQSAAVVEALTPESKTQPLTLPQR